MKQLRTLLTLLVVSFCAVQNAWADVEINETNFPDANFRTFLLEQDYGSDGVITDTEIAGIMYFFPCYRGITSLKGIEHFTSLVQLWCFGNQIKGAEMDALIESLPTKENGELYVIANFISGFDGNEMTIAQVAAAKAKGWKPLCTDDGNNWQEYAGSDPSKNVEINETNFPDTNFRTFLLSQSYGSDGVITDAEIAGITKINVNKKNIQSLKGIEFFTNLEQLRAESNQLTAIDVSKNTLLTLLNLTTNQLTTLDISKNLALTRVHVSENQLTELDVSKQTALESVECQNNQLTTLVLSNNPNLNFLECYNNNIKDAAMDALIKSMPLGSTSYRFRVLTTKPNEGNVMTTTQVAAAKSKGWSPNIGIYQGEIEGSVIYDWQEYEGSKPIIVGIEINETNFPDYNFRNYLLGWGYGSDGVITDEEISNIKNFYIGGRYIRNLKGIEYFTALTFLQCDNNQLTSLDLSQNKALTNLQCENNQLTSLDLSNNTALDYLECYNNQLTTLDVSKNTALRYLSCFNNQLTSLNVSGCTSLTHLACGNNQLTSLDLSNNDKLEYVDCSNNQIKGTAMDAFIESLPIVDDKALYIINSENEGNEMTAKQVEAAKDKGWRPYIKNGELGWIPYRGNDAVQPDPVEINETNFPDENFRNYILEVIDNDHDNILTTELVSVFDLDVSRRDIQSLKGIEYFIELDKLICHSNYLTSLDLSKNTKLRHLDCSNNQLTSLDLSNYTKLRSLDCSSNELTILDVSKNTALTSLHCLSNKIRWSYMDALVASLPVQASASLYVTDTNGSEGYNVMTTAQVAEAKAKGWEPLAYNGNDWVPYQGIEAPDHYIEIIPANFPDENFRNYLLNGMNYGRDGILTDEEIANITWMYVDGYNIADLKGIEFFTALTNLSCYNNQLTALDLSKNTALQYLVCNNNQLTALDLSKNTALQDLYCYSNQIKGAAMDTFIESLPERADNCILGIINNENESNEMTAAQAAAAKEKGWKPLVYNNEYYVWHEYLGKDVPESAPVVIDETNFPDDNFRTWISNLSKTEFNRTNVIFGCEISEITSISISGRGISNLKGIELFTALEELDCSYNQLTAIDVSKNTALKMLICDNNLLAALDVTDCTALTTLSCGSNKLTALDLSKNTALTDLSCNNNQLTELNLSKNTALATLSCSNNPLTTLDVSENTALTDLSCNNNQLTELNLSKNTALVMLSCSYNQLTALDLSKNENLAYLDCSYNQLTTLNVEGCTLLGLKTESGRGKLYCFGNQIKDEGMDTFVESLPDNTNNCALQVIGIENEGNAMTAAQVAVARAKGWKPLAYDEEDNRWYSYLGSGVPVPEPVEINETNFPDPLFRDYVKKFDRNNDGKISFYEGQRGDMEPDGRAIMSLKGIEFFTEIEGLWCHGDQLTTLDLSKNTQLKEVECQNNQIRGKGMDELIENLPKTRNAKLYVIDPTYIHKTSYGTFTEGNVMTPKQVSAAIAKGWTPYHCIARDTYGHETWVPYEGNIATVIQPITEETTVTFGGNSGVDENTNLSNTVVEDVLYTLDTTTGDGYDNTDQSITIVSTMSDADIAEMEELIPGTPEFAEKFNGITLELAAGEGSVTFDCQTVGNRQLTVKIGNAPAATYTKSDRGEVKVAYNVAEPCFMYIYATATSESRGTEPTAVANALKLYGYTVKPGDTTGIEAVESISSNETIDDAQATWYDLNGRRVTTPTKGIYVKNGKKFVVK